MRTYRTDHKGMSHEVPEGSEDMEGTPDLCSPGIVGEVCCVNTHDLPVLHHFSEGGFPEGVGERNCVQCGLIGHFLPLV